MRAPRVGSLPLLVGGLGASVLIVLAGGAVGPVPGAHVASTWLGTLARTSVDPIRDPWPGLLLFAGVVALVGAWLLLMRRIREGDVRKRTVCVMSAAWALPLALGPPVLSNDVFSYAAQGVMQLRGLSPYRAGPAALGVGHALAAVDPRWHDAISPYGPLAGFAERVAVVVTGGDALTAVVVLRVLAVIGVVAIGVLAYRLAPTHLRLSALGLTVANPLVLLQGLSAIHFEVLLSVLLLGSLLAARHRYRNWAVALGCAAGAVKFPGLAPAVVVGFGQLGTERRWRAMGKVIQTVAVVALSWLFLSHLVHDGWGWLLGLRTPGNGSTPLAPTQLLAAALGWPLSHLHLVSASLVTSVCRLAGVALALAIAANLLRTRSRRSVPMTVGMMLLAGAMLAPVLYPWYFLWGALCMAPVVTGQGRSWLVGLCAAGPVMDLPGMSRPVIATIGVVVGLVVLVAAGRGARVYWSTRATGAPPPRAHAVAQG